MKDDDLYEHSEGQNPIVDHSNYSFNFFDKYYKSGKTAQEKFEECLKDIIERKLIVQERAICIYLNVHGPRQCCFGVSYAFEYAIFIGFEYSIPELWKFTYTDGATNLQSITFTN